MRENILIILATGINTNASRNIFRDMKEEIKKRYAILGNTVKFVYGQKWGGHSAYFKRSLKNIYGIDNVTITVNAFWDKIK